MKNYLLFFMLFLLIVGCQNKISEKKVSPITTDSLSKSIPLKSNIDIRKFTEFWIVFRESVLKMDTTSIITFVEFPFEVNGREDNDPKFRIDKNKFIFVFKEFLKTRTEMEFVDNLNFINLTKNAENYSGFIPHDTTYQRMNDMIFEKKDSEWKLIRIYLDTKELKIR